MKQSSQTKLREGQDHKQASAIMGARINTIRSLQLPLHAAQLSSLQMTPNNTKVSITLQELLSSSLKSQVQEPQRRDLLAKPE